MYTRTLYMIWTLFWDPMDAYKYEFQTEIIIEKVKTTNLRISVLPPRSFFSDKWEITDTDAVTPYM